MKKIWKDLRALCLTVRIKELLTRLYYDDMRAQMTVFVPGIKNCYSCGKIGHIKKACQEAEHCLSCGGAKHTADYCQKCVNCKGKYKALNQRCPLITKEKEIYVMANRSVGYVEARRIFEGWAQSWSLIGKGNSGIDNKGRQNSVWVGGEKNSPPLRTTRKTDWGRPESLQSNQEKGHTTGWE
jgi:hypothetical protein